MKRHILLLLFTLYQSLLFATWLPPITNFTTRNSEGGRQNWDITQGKNGWLYFANNEGLLEYNGIDWTLYKLDNQSIVRSVESAHDGAIYVGGLNEFGRFKPDSMGRFTYSNLSDIASPTISDIGEVWGIHNVNEHTYFRTRRKIIILDSNDNFSKVMSDGIVLASCVMDNNLYFATTNGLYVMGEKSAICINSDENIPFGQISAISKYEDNKILIATSFSGLFIYDKGVLKRFYSEADEILKKNQLFSIEVGRSKIACGTVQGGIVMMDLDGKNSEQIDIGGGLGNNTVLSLLQDSEENVWCGLDNGIDRVTTYSPLRHLRANIKYRFSGYCSLKTSNNIYLGTNQGLLQIKLDNQQVTQSENIVKNSEGQVWNIQKVGEKILCSHTRGLFILDHANGEATLRSIYNGDGVWGVNQIDENRYLLGTYEGIKLMKIEPNKEYNIEPIGNYTNSSRELYIHSPSKSCFVVSEDGLDHLTFSNDYTAVTNNLILKSKTYDIKPFEIDGKLVIYTPSQIYIVQEDGSIANSDEYNELFETGVAYAMIKVFDKQNIWYEENNKLLLREYDNSAKKYKEQMQQIFDERHFFINGYTNIEPVENQLYLINNIYGFSVVDSHWKDPIIDESKPIISGLYAQDSLLMSEAYGIKHKSIKLPYSQNSLHFVLGSYSVNDATKEYSFRLRGYDNMWSTWSHIGDSGSPALFNRKEYTNLREGVYNFDIRAKGRSRDIHENTLEIIILPPWQRSKFMYCIYALLIIVISLYLRSLISQYYHTRHRQIELQKEREIIQQKREFNSKTMEQENSIIKLKNEKLESEVMAKSAELSNLLLNKLEKNDIIVSVKSDLDKIRIETLNERYDNVIRRLSSLNKRLDDKMIDNVDWNAFEENFNLINNNFVQKIGEQYSWMSINERKLCVYIKMGLQNKEIAPLLNLSVRGVEMLRYRIRKKMELERNEGLYEFLQRI